MKNRPCKYELTWQRPEHSAPDQEVLMEAAGYATPRGMTFGSRNTLSSQFIRDILYLAPTMANVGFKADESTSGDVAIYDSYLFSRGGELVSYALHLPSRMGSEPALDAAVECMAVLLRELHQYLLRPTWGRTESNRMFRPCQKTVSIYARALKDLQLALYDDERSRSGETLCAAELLIVFEVLTFPQIYPRQRRRANTVNVSV